MTIIEVKNQLVSHFYDKNVFDSETDFDKIEVTEELEGIKKDVIKAVLQDLVSIGMVKRIDGESKSVWILTQSFDSFNQSVILSAAASEVIGDTINQFREVNDIGGDLCDKTKITEADIMNLVNIIHVTLENENNFNNDDEEDKDSPSNRDDEDEE